MLHFTRTLDNKMATQSEPCPTKSQMKTLLALQINFKSINCFEVAQYQCFEVANYFVMEQARSPAVPVSSWLSPQSCPLPPLQCALSGG